MYRFSRASRQRLDTCHPNLIVLCEEVIKYWDFTVIEGHRSDERQAELLRTGMSQLGPGQSLHNADPSLAVDIGPYYPGEGIPWNKRERWLAFGGFVLGVAAQLDIPVRWGGDWDGDRTFWDQTFHDMPHFELKP